MLPYILYRNNVLEIQDREIPKETLDQLLDAGRLSPSIRNRQPWRFIAVTDMNKKLALQKACYGDERCLKGTLIAACSATGDYQTPSGLSANLFDLGLACGQILLQAEEDGLAAEPITSFSQSEASHILTLPYGMYVAAIVLLGYPMAIERDNISYHRLPLERTVNYNSW